ncbi:MAG: ATP-binding protein, partial [Candidatus Heimdallarchaeota archaeon]|nr:ATP-binding protein [Candidatus Heimdallarchaeota archaeon]
MNDVAKIVIGSDYFRKNARSDYASPLPFVWIREAMQNSIDAGATEIKISTEGNNITFTDNGCGMDLDVLTHKLLTLGGTKKESGSVGGFGKAKEVLFFSWDEWFIDTGTDGETRYFISESMIGNEPIQIYKDKDKDVGTTIGITIEDGLFGGIYNWCGLFEEYVKLCTTE